MLNKNLHRKILLPVVIMLTWLGSQSLQARHIIGGEVTYECVGIDTIRNEVTFRFICTVYRDCFGGGADFDPTFNFGIYYNTNNGWRLYDVQSVNVSEIELIAVDDSNPCVIIPPDVCVEKGVYTFERRLPLRNSNYMVAFQRCCRNNTITNIFDPGDQGAAYTVEITPQAQMACNSSPTFNSFPPIVICADQDLDYDHSAIDPEGDDLVYEFCTPLTAGGQLGTAGQPCPPGSCDCVIPDPSDCLPPFDEVVFKVPVYTSTRPIPGDPVITIDQVTGRITGTPNEQGQFVVGVCVREFRNGVLMTTFRREFQFNVTLCEPTVNAQIQADGVAGDNQYLVNSCGDNTIDFVNLSTQERFIGDYYWEFDLNGQIDSFSSKDITVEFPGVGQYTGLMAINRGLDCSDTAYITVNVFPEIEANFSFDYDTCVAGPVTFVDSSFSGSGTITDWNWDFDGEGGSTVQGPEYQFRTPGDKAVTLSVTDVNECEDELEQVIPYYPVPPLIIVEPSSFIGCAPASIRFVNLSVPIDDSYEIIWDFGDGNTGDAISPTHIFEEPGIYDIRIDITSPIGCQTSAEFPAWITVEPSPEADFDFNPKELSSFEKTVNFTDLSQRASSWQWTFDDEGVLFDQNPTFTFQDTGVHRVELIVLHPSGCPDTIVKFIDVVPVNTFYLPTAFTPNGDGRNDGFRGVGFVEGMTNFSMSIWNRWGEQVFFTEDPQDSWNGQKDNTGQVCPEAVYVYQVSYEAPRGKKEEVKGYVTLIR